MHKRTIFLFAPRNHIFSFFEVNFKDILYQSCLKYICEKTYGKLFSGQVGNTYDNILKTFRLLMGKKLATKLMLASQ